MYVATVSIGLASVFVITGSAIVTLFTHLVTAMYKRLGTEHVLGQGKNDNVNKSPKSIGVVMTTENTFLLQLHSEYIA